MMEAYRLTQTRSLQSSQNALLVQKGLLVDKVEGVLKSNLVEKAHCCLKEHMYMCCMSVEQKKMEGLPDQGRVGVILVH